MLRAIVTNIFSLSTHDGPGLRSTVFFKGCSLKCVWCHNPETYHQYPETAWDTKKCIACKTCKKICPNGAIDFNKQRKYLIDKSVCMNCGKCVDECPSSALYLIGKNYSVDELYHQLLKDDLFIKKSNGGITFSGGEPALQYRFIEALSKKLKERKYHLALDTCGVAPIEAYDAILPFIDLVLFDIKEMNEGKHIDFTGASNQKVFNTLAFIQQKFPTIKIWIRTPIIPDMTDSTENIMAIGTFISKDLYGLVDKWELCAFNNLCNDKYTKLGLEWALKDKELLPGTSADKLLAIAKVAVKDTCTVTFSGLTKNERP